MQLYPNPTSDYFKLDIATSKVEIYSISGKLVSSFDKNQEVGFQFSVNNLENGLYLIKVSGRNEEQKVFKLFKN
ncbi:T9SS type A sorting domain-containing protein [Flavobacterium sp. PL12]|uniref:T9SS type A sorting domain-containing protein n=1 Tax=Flavobacterium sp. PL12 TaxID=3071718 RepID=UPI00319E0818